MAFYNLGNDFTFINSQQALSTNSSAQYPDVRKSQTSVLLEPFQLNYLNDIINREKGLNSSRHMVRSINASCRCSRGLPGGIVQRIHLPVQEMHETWVWPLGWEDPLEEKMATHSSILAWKVPWAEEPGWLQSMGLQRIGYNWMSEHTHSC